jgi:hypothetical protein
VDVGHGLRAELVLAAVVAVVGVVHGVAVLLRPRPDNGRPRLLGVAEIAFVLLFMALAYQHR